MKSGAGEQRRFPLGHRKPTQIRKRSECASLASVSGHGDLFCTVLGRVLWAAFSGKAKNGCGFFLFCFGRVREIG